MALSLKHLVCATVMVAASYIGTASAAFSSGNSIEAAYFSPNLSTPYVPPVVTNGPNDVALDYAGFLDITYTDTSIRIQLTRDGGPNFTPFDGVRFTDLVGNLNFGAWTNVASETTIVGSLITFEADRIFVNFAEITGRQGQTLLLVGSPVPLPPSAALLLPAIGVLGVVRRKRAG